MATPLELLKIEVDASLAILPGEPAEVTQARDLLNRVRQALVRRGNITLSDQAPAQGNMDTLDLIEYSRTVAVRAPDQEKIPIFRMFLAGLPGNLSVADILTTATDTQIDNRVTQVVTRLAKGTYR